MRTIKDITGSDIEVTDLKAAIQQYHYCSDSHYKMESGHTIGENHQFMLKQLEALLQEDRRDKWLPSTKARYEAGKRFTKLDMGYEIGRHEAYHPASLYWDTYTREQMLLHFNTMFGTDIQ